jgi:hypothetical protein
MLGQAGSGPALMGSFHWARLVLAHFRCVCGPESARLSGPGLAQTEIEDFVRSRLAQIPDGPRSAHPFFGPSPAQLAGPAQPSPPNIIYYLL